MAENNNENGKFVRAHTPMSAADINALRGVRLDAGTIRPAAKSEQANEPQKPQPTAEATQQQGAEKPQGPITPKQEMLMLEEQDRRGLLTLDERARLEDLRKLNDADGLINQKQNDRTHVDEPDSDKFSEMDVIKYMYEKWLLAGLDWCSRKVEKGITIAWDRGCRRVSRRLEERTADNAAYKAGPTYKTAEKIKTEVEKRSEQKRAESKAEIAGIKDISLKIADGSLFDKDENGKYSKEAKQFAQYVGLTDEQGNIDESKIPESKAWQNLQQQFDKYKAAKEGAEEGKDFAEATKLRELGTKFGTALGRRVTYDCNRDIAALQTAGARMMHEIAVNDKAYDGQDISKAFGKNFERADTEMRQQTDAERNAYVVKPISGMGLFNEVGLDNMETKARSLGLKERAKLASMGLRQFGAEAPNLAHLAVTADNAIAREFEGIGEKRVKECGKQTIEDNHLATLNQELSGNSNQNSAANVEAYVVEEPAPEANHSEQAQDLREAANDSNQHLNDLGRQKDNIEKRMAANDAKQEEHRNSPMAQRLKWMKRHIKHGKEQIAEKAGNMFSGLRIDSSNNGY